MSSFNDLPRFDQSILNDGKLHIIINYWQGKVSLQTSFLFVFAGLLILIYFFESTFLPFLFNDLQQQITVTFISLIITKLIIFPWQFIGLLRASDKDFLKEGNIGKTRVIQLMMVLAVGFILSTSIDVIQSASFKKKQQQLAEDYQTYKKNQIAQYQLTLRNKGTQLVISGEIEIGITKAVSIILKTNPQISSVALNSIGGHIYEGRGLSKLFTRQSLDTYVYKECSSACATAFSGGIKRFLSKSGKLGFHQYTLDMKEHTKSVGFHDATAEQERDLELFKSRGIHSSFLDKIFNERSDSM